MAKEEAPEVEVEAPKKKGKLIIILAAVAVLVIGAGVAAFFLLSSPDAEEAAKAGEAEVEQAEDEHPPVYEKLETFTVNLADQESYLQTDIQLLLGDASLQSKIKERMPEVRDALIRLLSSKTAEELALQDGKDALANEILQTMNDVLKVKDKSEGVKKVLFAAFIIQS
jgi:flagellar FliL protein